jgi:aspartate-semialdehyde dehydrogenase
MKIAVIGARGSVGRACVQELMERGHVAIELGSNENVPKEAEAVIIATPIDDREFHSRVVDCSGELENTSLVLPNILESRSERLRVPNCMASLIAQALATLHIKCTIMSIVAVCMQAASGAGWRGVKALEQNDTEDLFHGDLINNILPHENFLKEEKAIKDDLHSLFGCKVQATSFRVPVLVGHLASLRIKTQKPIDDGLFVDSICFDPKSMENQREVAIGRIRTHKNIRNLVVCGDQLLCGTAIPAVDAVCGVSN